MAGLHTTKATNINSRMLFLDKLRPRCLRTDIRDMLRDDVTFSATNESVYSLLIFRLIHRVILYPFTVIFFLVTGIV